ncbi:MAG: amidohydrolase family protein [Candidatus Latescibacterota bacterium]|nr:amidohydrolase family protein [Candidatus Latescibacterota bacterium]
MLTGDFEAYIPDEFNGALYGLEGVLATMEGAGIDFSVVFPGGVPPDPRAINRLTLEACRGEDRLLPGCLVNPTMGAVAVDDLCRCVDHGARTVKLMAALHGYRVDSTCVDPVMEAAAERGIPATIHSGSERAGCTPTYIAALAGRHPTVTIIMDHMGYREWTRLAVDAATAHPNIILGTTLIAAAEPITIKQIVEEGHVGADRIAFGSNAPSGMAKAGVEGICEVGFAPEDEAAILGGTLTSIYAISLG